MSKVGRTGGCEFAIRKGKIKQNSRDKLPNFDKIEPLMQILKKRRPLSIWNTLLSFEFMVQIAKKN